MVFECAELVVVSVLACLVLCLLHLLLLVGSEVVLVSFQGRSSRFWPSSFYLSFALFLPWSFWVFELLVLTVAYRGLSSGLLVSWFFPSLSSL